MADIDKIKRNIAKMIDMGAPEEDIDNYVSSEGVTLQDLQKPKISMSDFAKPQQPQSRANWQDLPGNVGPSAQKLGEDVVSFVSDPIGAVDIATKVGVGAISQFFPDYFEGEEMREAEKMAQQVGRALGERYGGWEEVRNTMITDPVGFASDVGGLLMGGGAAAAKLGATTGKLAKAGSMASKVGGFVDPISLAGKTAGKAAQFTKRIPGAATGALSGVGEGAVSELYKAGKQGGKAKAAALAHMRDSERMGPEILDMARTGMAKLRRQKNEAYNSGMIDIRRDASIIDFDRVDDAFSKVIAENRTKTGHVKNSSKEAAIKDIESVLAEWRKRGPDSHTPDDFNSMKEEIGDLVNWQEKGQKTNLAYNEMYNSVKNLITEKAPVYADTMADYMEASDQIKDLEKALGMGNKTGAETAYRKLTSSMRNNVNTNFGERSRLVGELENASGMPLKAAIAGQSASPLTPRGLQGLGATGNIGAMAVGGINPAQIPLLAAQSPRIVGEGAVAAGTLARQAGNVIPGPLRNTGIPSAIGAAATSPALRQGAIQGGRFNEMQQSILAGDPQWKRNYLLPTGR